MKRTFTTLITLTGVVLYAATGWIAGIVLMVAGLVSFVQLLRATARELAIEVFCPRGHRVPTYGRAACGQCGWIGEGSIWRCSHCGARYGHTPCQECGLSVANPGL